MLIILSVIFLEEILPPGLQQILYAISLTAKAIIVFLLPIIIFGLLFKDTINLAQDATRIIIMFMLAVCCSNFMATFLSHYIGGWIYHLDLSLIVPKESNNLISAWSFHLPTLILNSQAMLAAIILGVITIKFKPVLAYKVAAIFKQIVSAILKGFSLLIPIFVTGFIIKLQYEGVVGTIIKDYTRVFAVVLFTQNYIFKYSLFYG